MGNAAKVGAIFVVFLGLLFATYAALGQRLFAQKKVEYKITFADADGITPGTKVLMAGVEVGLVQEVKLLSPTLAQATFTADPATKIPQGTKAVLPASLVGLGESSVDLVAPPIAPGQTYPSLSAGATIPGSKAGPLDTILPDGKEQIGETLKEVTATIRATRKLLEDQALLNRTKSLLNSVDIATQNAGRIAGRVDTLLVRNDARINNTFATLSKTVRNVERATNEVARFAESGQLQGDVKGLFRELKTTTAQARGLLVEFQGLVGDPKLQADIKRTTGNVADASGSAATIAKTSEETARSAANIAKTAEGIATDGKQITAKLIDLTERANIVADRAIRIEEQIGNILGRFGGNRKPGEPGKGLSLPPVSVRLDVMGETDPEHTRADIYLDVPLGKQNLSIGFYDAFESNRLIAQLGHPFGAGQFRYGLFAGKPGIGVDYPLGSQLSFRGDVWGLNDPRLDLRFRVRIADGFYGWAGADRVFRDNAPTFGFGISY